MVIKRTSHAVYDTSYHLVWCPKYRKNIFEREEVKERAVQLIREISEEYGFDLMEMEVAIEHVHIFRTKLCPLLTTDLTKSRFCRSVLKRRYGLHGHEAIGVS